MKSSERLVLVFAVIAVGHLALQGLRLWHDLQQQPSTNERVQNKKNFSHFEVNSKEPFFHHSRNHNTTDKAPCLIVYHVPKTGGSSLGQLLESLAKLLGWRIQPWYHYFEKYGDQDPPLFNKSYYNHSMIHLGHLTPRFEQVTYTKTCFKATILREPVDRVVSAFFYHGHKERDWSRCLQKKCKHWHQYHNDVVRRFAGRGKAWNSYAIDSYITENDKNNSVDSSLLTDAQHFLTSLDFVCFLDDIRGCIRRLTRALLPLMSSREKFVNKSPLRRPVNQTVKQLVAQANELDVELYQWAIEQVGGQYQ